MLKPFVRYAGGKSRHTDKILKYFRVDEPEYREPFVGGGSVYLASGFKNAWINDFDPGVAAMWQMVKEQPEEMARLIEEYTPKIDHGGDPDRIKEALETWRTIRDDREHRLVPAGFRTLFLIKTCFSGVTTGGPTGGVEQKSDYTINTRWAKDHTIRRIRAASTLLQSCRITKESWQPLVETPGHDVALFLDPPYLVKGDQCYEFAFTLEQHKELAEKVARSPHRWVVTIDDCPEIREIWSQHVPEKCMISETWLYSMTDTRDANRVGRELFIIDPRSLKTRVKKRIREFPKQAVTYERTV